ncbi:MAG: radical SAM protein, partial [Nitrospinae bacterium]|nr:radical SAM protein [Nitrospinota bacterium]
MRIFFYHPTSASTEPEPPLGLAMLIAVAQEEGHHVEFYDQDLHHKEHSFDRLLKGFQPELFVITAMTPQYFHCQKAISLVKDMFPHCKTILGGPHASALPDSTMKEIEKLDFLCVGEGEKTFKEFLLALNDQQENFDDIKGLFWRKEGKTVFTGERELMKEEELDALPMAAWDVIFKKGLYFQTINYVNKPVPVFSIITTRGCPFECTFCDENSIWKRKVRERKIAHVIEEIKYLKETFHAEHFNVLDDTFTLKPKRVKEFCGRVKQFNLSYRITAKVNTVTQEMLYDIADSGCKLVSYGVESGDEEVLKIMKKKQSLEAVKKAFEMTKKTGMVSYALCMVGNIGEGFNEVRKTAEFVKHIKADLFSAAIMTPYPGSENYHICE